MLQQEVDEVVPILTQRVTQWPFFVFMGASMFCLLSSFDLPSAQLQLELPHLVAPLPRLHWNWDHDCNQLFPPVYYVFLCQPVWQQFYLTSISMIGVSTVIISLVPVFQTPKYRAVHGLAFASMGMSGIVPAAHKLMYFHHEPYCLHTLVYELTMGLFYMVGVIIYIACIPQCWPGLFDLPGHSHQIFHVLVVAGAFTHYKGGLPYLVRMVR
jgi:adiponectin receptor